MTDFLDGPLSPAELGLAYARLTGTVWYEHPHIALMDEYLLRLIAGEFRFLIIEVPSRHGKSMLCSVFLPAWYKAWFPHDDVMIVSYGQTLADEFGALSRDVMLATADLFPHKPRVRIDAKAKSRWGLAGSNGMVRCFGVDGPIIGKGGKLIILDDLVKDDEEADSPAARDRLYARVQSKLRGRLAAGGKMVLVMQRWHPDDVAGRLQKQSIEKPKGDQWKVLRLPALCDDPENDPLGRKLDEALCEPFVPQAELMQIRESTSSRIWAANYQQAPRNKSGAMLDREKFKTLDVLPAGQLRWVRRWDLAASDPEKTGGNPDWTAGALACMTEDRRFVIVDVRRTRREDAGVRSFIGEARDADRARVGRKFAVRMEQEPGSSGKAIVATHKRDSFVGWDFEGRTSSRSKRARAQPLSDALEAGNVYILRVQDEKTGEFVRPQWAVDLLDECDDFPDEGDHDDQVDAVSGAFTDLAADDADADNVNVRARVRAGGRR